MKKVIAQGWKNSRWKTNKQKYKQTNILVFVKKLFWLDEVAQRQDYFEYSLTFIVLQVTLEGPTKMQISFHTTSIDSILQLTLLTKLCISIYRTDPCWGGPLIQGEHAFEEVVPTSREGEK